MEEDYIIIHKDDEQIITIPRWFQDFLNRRVRNVRVSQEQVMKLLPLIYAQLSALGVNIKTAAKLYSSVVPIITYGYGLSLEEPFNKFSDVIEVIASSPNPRKDKKIIEEYCAYYSEFSLEPNENIYCRIFDVPIGELYGWLAYYSGTNLTILFWGYENKNENDDDYLMIV